MTFRKLPGAIALGAPAALLAHMALFGGGHTVGGSLHDLVLYGTFAAAALFALALSLLAWRGASLVSTGSILAARLYTHLPSPSAIFGSALAIYAGIESLEARHDPANLVLLVCALFAAAFLLQTLARCTIRAFATIAIAIATVPNHVARDSKHIIRTPQRFFFATSFVATHRLFARPPPSF